VLNVFLFIISASFVGTIAFVMQLFKTQIVLQNIRIPIYSAVAYDSRQTSCIMALRLFPDISKDIFAIVFILSYNWGVA
jgi:hypothetical protein